MSELIKLEPGTVVESWKIVKKLGEGGFGAVYTCTDSKNNIYALKVENKNEKIQVLKMEVCVMTELANSSNRHFCAIIGKGRVLDFNFLVMTLVGKSLAELRTLSPENKFSLGTAVSISIQCLEALEDLHTVGYIHRDIKPSNFAIGRAEANELRKIYLLDFGMARKFLANDGKTLLRPRRSAAFRWDDVESWMYMTVEITRGNLPWKNFKQEKEVATFKKKMRNNPYLLTQCFGGCPPEYKDILTLRAKHTFYDRPEYDQLYKIMKDAMLTHKATLISHFVTVYRFVYHYTTYHYFGSLPPFTS